MHITGSFKQSTVDILESVFIEKIEVNTDLTLSIHGERFLFKLDIGETKKLVKVVMIKSLQIGFAGLADSSGLQGLLPTTGEEASGETKG